jgi:muramoyltetrapeptide carboxypeptidase LdcA involved in peptidoglycan recycling
MDIDKAKKVLEEAGYYVNNLWHVNDVHSRFDCSKDEAMNVLEEALTSDSTFETIWFNIDYFGKEEGLVRND